ncbi:dickkopf-related protein 3 [Spea bombifrons]|uniref:dickkopf-related protein 3 n=1 Tax=Spea bombifrons TaxID=233779 RepID=UPI00234BC81D|nr:dickkopf-related protein 3 [Spea bombifrons]
MSRLILLILPWVLGTGSPDVMMVDADVSLLERALGPGEKEDTLNEMFKEVEELMRDTQTKLKNAVDEMEAENASAGRFLSLKLNDLPPNYRNESVTETKEGNRSVTIRQDIAKETDNKTGATSYFLSVITSVREKKSHECVAREDCGERSYCDFSHRKYKCLPCKESGKCTQAGECCEGQLCVWGQCAKSTRGQNGTICEGQKDCAAGLCCTTQHGLPYAVCAPLPVKGDPCDYLEGIRSGLWNLEPGEMLDRCPCSTGLTCQLQSHALEAFCEESPENDYRDETADPLGPDIGVSSSALHDDLMGSEGP